MNEPNTFEVNGWLMVPVDGEEEPRIPESVEAERLGYSRPRDFRKIIDGHRQELEKFGHIAERAVAARSGKLRGVEQFRVKKEYLLNEPQALLAAIFSEGDNAASIREEIIRVYMAVRRGMSKSNVDVESVVAKVLPAMAIAVGQILAPFMAAQNEMNGRILEALTASHRETLEAQTGIGTAGATQVKRTLKEFAIAAAGGDKSLRRSIRAGKEKALRSEFAFDGTGRIWEMFPRSKWPDLRAKLEEIRREAERMGGPQGGLPGVN